MVPTIWNISMRYPPKRFLAALERAMKQDDGTLLRKAAEKLLKLAAAGEPWAVQMLADRLDGKAAQEISAEIVHAYVAELPDIAPSGEAWSQQLTHLNG